MLRATIWQDGPWAGSLFGNKLPQVQEAPSCQNIHAFGSDLVKAKSIRATAAHIVIHYHKQFTF